MITYQAHEISSHILTPEGAQIALEGSHEARVWAALPTKGVGTPLTPQQLKKRVGDDAAKVGQGRAFKNGWISKEGDGLVRLVSTLSWLVHFSHAHTLRWAGHHRTRYHSVRSTRSRLDWNTQSRR
jgi:hypothetical protein